MIDDDNDDDMEWDEWMAMTDAQRDATERRVMGEYRRFIDAMTPAQYYRYQRWSWLRILSERREFLRNPAVSRIEIIDQITLESIGRARLALAKLRIWRSTGVYPGEA
jgi:hypothetical protein